MVYLVDVFLTFGLSWAVVLKEKMKMIYQEPSGIRTCDCQCLQSTVRFSDQAKICMSAKAIERDQQQSFTGGF